MAEKQPTLEERLKGVAKAGKGYIGMSQILDQYKRDPTNKGIFNEFIKYGGEPLPEEEAQELSRDVYRVRGLMESCLEDEQNGLIKQVEDNCAGVLSALSANDVLMIAGSLPDKDKKYLAVKQAVESGRAKPEDLRKAYAATFKNKVWKKFIEDPEEGASDRFIAAYAKRYVELKELEFRGRFYKEVEEKGKKKQVLDEGKVRGYVAAQLLSYKPEARKAQYLQIGGFYASKILQKEQEKAEKAKQKAA